MTQKSKTIFIILASISILLFLTFSILILTNNNTILNLDNNIAKFFASKHTDFFDWLFVLLSILGGTKVIILICLILLLLPNRKKLGIPLTIIVSISAIINLILKLIVARERPDGLFASNLPLGYAFPDGYSFPSGHAQTTTVFYLTLTFLLCKNYIKNKALKTTLWCLCFVLIAGTSFARIYLCVHFTTDVICGLLLANFLINICHIFMLTLPFFKNKLSHQKDNN